ncbi:MAG: DUF3035 domain-containing protein [Pseudomonadota bacterium]
MTLPTSLRRPASRGLRLAALTAAALACAACGGREAVGRAFGLTYESPNPFNVSPRAPLRLPGDLSALPPPEPGAPSPLEPQPTRSARAALANAGAPSPAQAAPTPSELALLDAAGVQTADPGIRAALAEEQPERRNDYALPSLFGLEIPDGSEEELLEPRQEADRIRAAGGVAPNPTPAPPEPQSNQITLF